MHDASMEAGLIMSFGYKLNAISPQNSKKDEVEKNTHWSMVALPPMILLTSSLKKAEPRCNLFPCCDYSLGLQEWPKGSLEETVQNAVKSWEMELSHKTRLRDFRTINPEKFKLIVNGREGLSGEETLKLGSYNALLKSSLPED
ncbi:Pathogen-related protein [Vitis vinifera]|uniref:Pathogen-related protein n=1 Tax=Vitis vinifera TaxID=29760 RepID=A0A438E5P4_VITVI|nr:Pathogen-related protein [Vitis vinifera]